jgi:hypothetical protein
MTRVIGICGHKGSGKGEVSGMIAALVDRTVVVAFADKLKILAMKSLGFDRTDLELIQLWDSMKTGSSMAAYYYEPGETVPTLHDFNARQLVQNMGNNIRDLLGDEVWIDQILPPVTGPLTHQSAVRWMYPGTDLVVVTDIRYENEGQRVLALDGEIWEVQRPGCEPDGHISERPLPRHMITRTIYNDCTLAQLEYRVKQALDA